MKKGDVLRAMRYRAHYRAWVDRLRNGQQEGRAINLTGYSRHADRVERGEAKEAVRLINRSGDARLLP